MEKEISLKKNFIMNMILTVSQFIFPLISFQYVSHILLPEGTGKVSFAASVVSYFLLISRMGIPTYGIRACAKVRDDREKLIRIVQELLIINLCMVIVSYIILFSVIAYVPKLKAEKSLYIVLGTQIFLDAIGIEWLYKALEKYSYITIRSIVFKTISLLLMFIFIHTRDDYIYYGVVTIFASSASNVFNFFHASHYILVKPIGGYNLKYHIKPVIIFFAMSCAATIYTHLDSVMLGFMTSDIEVGYYNAAVRIRAVLVSIVTSLGVVLLPRSSYYIEKGVKEEFFRVSKKALNFVFFLAMPLMVYFIIFAKQGIYFLAGIAYKGSIMPLQVIMPTVLLVGITNVLGIQMLVPMGKENVVLISEIAGALVDLVINTLLIPHYTSVGAAIGTLIAEFVVLIVQWHALRKEVTKLFADIQYWKIIFAVIIAVFLSTWIKAMISHRFFVLLTSASIFFIIYAIALLIMGETLTLEIMNQVLKKIKK